MSSKTLVLISKAGGEPGRAMKTVTVQILCRTMNQEFRTKKVKLLRTEESKLVDLG